MKINLDDIDVRDVFYLNNHTLEQLLSDAYALNYTHLWNDRHSLTEDNLKENTYLHLKAILLEIARRTINDHS